MAGGSGTPARPAPRRRRRGLARPRTCTAGYCSPRRAWGLPGIAVGPRLKVSHVTSPASPATPTSRATNDRIVWIDCEMTGLSLTDDALIEVAALVTDFELNQLGGGVDVVIMPPVAAMEQMDPFVHDMH